MTGILYGDQSGRVDLEVIESTKEANDVIDEYRNVFGYGCINFCIRDITPHELAVAKSAAFGRLFAALNAN